MRSVISWSPSVGRHFSISVVTPEGPGDLELFILFIALDISLMVGSPDRSFAIGLVSLSLMMLRLKVIFLLNTLWKWFSKILAFSFGEFAG